MTIHTRGNTFNLNDFFQLTSPRFSPRKSYSFSPRELATSGTMSTAKSHQNNPSVDIIENNDSYELVMELAGVKKENIAITLENSTLIITAEKTRKEITEEATKTVRTERSFGTLSRRFNLGQDIEQDNIEASFIDGLLTVSVFKVKKNEPVQRTIEIH